MELGVRLDSLTLPTCHPEQSSARPQHSYYSYYHYHCSYLLVPAVPSILWTQHYYYYSYYHHHYSY